jgi:hypothetical protein
VVRGVIQESLRTGTHEGVLGCDMLRCDRAVMTIWRISDSRQPRCMMVRIGDM